MTLRYVGNCFVLTGVKNGHASECSRSSDKIALLQHAANNNKMELVMHFNSNYVHNTRHTNTIRVENYCHEQQTHFKKLSK